MSGPTEYIISADLGQARDHTAVIIAERVRGEEGGRDHYALWIRYARRLPLGASYVDQIESLATLRHSSGIPELEACTLLLDATGVGRAVTDMAQERNLRPTPITITAGDTPRQDPKTRFWNVPKHHMIDALVLMAERGRIVVSSGIDAADALRDEMMAFEGRSSVAGNTLYGAAPGHHDDLVLSLAMMAWWVTKSGPVNWSRDDIKHIRRRSTFGTRRPVWRERGGRTRGQWRSWT